MNEKRFNELYTRAFEKHYNTFTEFLNLDEQSILISSYLPCEKFGGYDSAERVVAGFGTDIKKEDYPITCIGISPLNQKFSQKLTHRDVLGSVMSLGIKREMLGDILINNSEAYLFCLTQISEYIKDNISRISHTSVKAEIVSQIPDGIISEPESREIIVSSLRLDAIISTVYKLSRSEASKLFSNGRVFVNSKLTENSSHKVRDNDIISVRGYGRFVFENQVRTTKKERLIISVKIY